MKINIAVPQLPTRVFFLAMGSSEIVQTRNILTRNRMSLKRSVLRPFSLMEKQQDEQELESQRHHLELVASWPKWRRRVRKVVEHRYFEYVVFIVIGINCFILGSANITALDAASSTMATASDALVWIFVIEIILRYISCGFKEFTRHYWYLFDALLIALSVVGFFMDFSATSRTARVLRVARPLRALSASGPMKTVVEAILACARVFAYVALLCLTFMVGLTYTSLFLFRDEMSFRCVPQDLALVYQTNISRRTLSDSSISSCSSSSFPGNFSFSAAAEELLSSGLHRIVRTPDLLPADPHGTVCQYGQLCIRTLSIEFGYTNFNTFVTTQTALFSLILPDDYGPIMYQLIDSKGWIASYFTVPVVAVGTLFVLALPLVVVVDGFNRSQKRKMANREALTHLQHDVSDDEDTAFEFTRLRRFYVSPEDFTDWFGPTSFSISRKITAARYFIRKHIISRPWFNYIIVAVIVVNALILATAHLGMSDTHQNFINVAAQVFVVFFVIEMGLKIFSVPLKVWFADKMNLFDLAVTLASAAELFATQSSALAMLRVVRLFRLLTTFRPLRRSTNMLICGLSNSMPLMMIMLILLLLYSILGVQIFAGKMCGLGKDLPFSVTTTFCSDVPRANFDNIGYALTFLLTVAAGDGWRPFVAAALDAADTEYATYFFMSCRIICGYLVLNLFVATLAYTSVHMPVVNEALALFSSFEDQEEGAKEEELLSIPDSSPSRENEATEAITGSSGSNISENSISPHVANSSGEQEAALQMLEEQLLGTLYSTRTLGVGSEESRARRLISGLVTSQAYIYVSTALAIVSMGSVVFYRPTSFPDHSLNYLQQVLDVMLAVLFSLDAAMLMVHQRLWQRTVLDPNNGCATVRRGYFRDPSRLFEFCLLLCNIGAALLVFLSSLSSVRPHYRVIAEWLRVARSFRVWTVVSRYKTLSIVFRSLTRSAPALLHGGIITFFTFLGFSILGTQLFMGKINACQDVIWGDVTFSYPHIHNRSHCVEQGFAWKAAPQNFDNVFNSFSTLFQVSVRSEWAPIIWAATDGSGSDTSPEQLKNQWAPLFFYAFILLVAFFLVNVFVTSLIEAYFATKAIAEENLARLRITKMRQRKRSRSDAKSPSRSISRFSDASGRPDEQFDDDDSSVGLDELTASEADYLTMYRRAVYCVRPPLLVAFAKGSALSIIRKFVRSPWFEYIQFLLVVLQVAALGIRSRNPAGSTSQSIVLVNVVLNVLIAGITSLKGVVYGLKSFLKQRRNCFDSAINCISLIGDALYFVPTMSMASDVLRLLQLCRLYRLAFLSNQIMMLLRTLGDSLKNFAVVFLFLFITVFQFTSVGQVLFGRVKWTGREGLFQWANFDRFDIAAYTMVRVGTGAAGLNLMETSCSVSPPDCDPNLGECGWPIVAPVFKIVFMICVNWIGVNLVAAVLLDSFTRAEREEYFAIQPEDVASFAKSWKQVASTDSSRAFVTIRELYSLLLRLEGGLAVNCCEPYKAMMLLGPVTIRRHGDQMVVFKRHVFRALIESQYGMWLPKRHKASLTELLESRFRDIELEQSLPTAAFDLDHVGAATVVQRLFRQRLRSGSY